MFACRGKARNDLTCQPLRHLLPYKHTHHTHTERRAGLNQEKPFFEVKLPGSLVPWVKSRIRCELANPAQRSIQRFSCCARRALPPINVLRLEREGGRNISVCWGGELFSPVMHISSGLFFLAVRIHWVGRLRGRHAHTDTLHGYQIHRSITQIWFNNILFRFLYLELTFLQRGFEQMYLNASFLLTSVVIPVKFPRPQKEAAEHRVGVLSRCS